MVLSIIPLEGNTSACRPVLALLHEHELLWRAMRSHPREKVGRNDLAPAAAVRSISSAAWRSNRFPTRSYSRTRPFGVYRGVTTVIVVILVRINLASRVNCMASGKALTKKGPHMATSSTARKESAEDVLLESFGELIDSAAEKMSDKEFKQAEKKSTESLARALARPKQRRETA